MMRGEAQREVMKERRTEGGWKGGREGKMGNPAHAASMLFAGMHHMYVYLGQAEKEKHGGVNRQESVTAERKGV